MNEGGFHVKVGEFEGPLDLLLDLIEKRKLHVSEVTLSDITEDFLAHIKTYESLPTYQVAHFVLIASTLLLIKSKNLLPQFSLSPEEKGDILELEERLKFLGKVRILSQSLKKYFENSHRLFWGGEKRETHIFFAPSKDVSQQSLAEAISRTLHNIPLLEALPKIHVQKTLSLEEMMKQLASRIEQSFSLSFKEFSKAHAHEKKSVIVGFLALLELVKQGILLASQDTHFDDIRIHKDKVGVPEYN